MSKTLHADFAADQILTPRVGPDFAFEIENKSPSSQIITSSWLSSAVTKIDNNRTAPDGTETMGIVYTTSSNAWHGLRRGWSTPLASDVIVLSCYFRPHYFGPQAFISATESGGALRSAAAVFDITNGVFNESFSQNGAAVLAQGIEPATVTFPDAASDIYRAWATIQIGIASGYFIYFGTSNSDGTPTYAANGLPTFVHSNQQMNLWGMMAETGYHGASSVPSTYIPTVATPVKSFAATNSADAGYLDSNGILINADRVVRPNHIEWAGLANTHYTKFNSGTLGAHKVIRCLHDGTANNYMILEIGGPAGPGIAFRGVAGGVEQWSIYHSAVAADTDYGIAAGWKAGSQVLAIDGVEIGTASAAAIPTVTTYNLGSGIAGANQLNSTIATDINYNEEFLPDVVRKISGGRLPSPLQFSRELSRGLSRDLSRIL